MGLAPGGDKRACEEMQIDIVLPQEISEYQSSQMASSLSVFYYLTANIQALHEHLTHDSLLGAYVSCEP